MATIPTITTRYSVEQVPGGFAVMRGNKPVVTPAGNPLVLPTRRLAEGIVYEWEEQGEKVQKALLQLTPIACVAIDVATSNREAMMADLLPYIETDLVCYRAENTELAKDQDRLWNPLLEWVKERYGIVLNTTTGLSVKQDGRNMEILREILEGLDIWRLAVFAVAIKPLGSAVLALALLERRINHDYAFHAGCIEEDFQTRHWGVVHEKEVALAARRADIKAASDFLAALAEGI